MAFAVLDYEEQEAFASSMSHGGGEAARRHAVILTVRWRQTEKGWPRRGGYHAACCATGAKYSGGLRTYRPVNCPLTLYGVS